MNEHYFSKTANVTDEYDVKCYELLPKYLDTNDTTDEQELFNRLAMEKNWDAIPDILKRRILAVDQIVLDKYADCFDYNVFNDFIMCIKRRRNLELIFPTSLTPTSDPE